MKKLLVLIGLVVLLTLIISFAPGTQALANRPDKLTWQIDETFSVDDSEAQCGFPITEHEFGQLTVIGFYDSQGEFRGYHMIAGQKNVVWSAHGKEAKLQPYGPFTYQIKPDGDIWWVSLGAAHILTLPGYGYVGGDAGQDSMLIDGETGEVIKSKRAGHFDVFNWDAICSYFE